MGKDYPLKFPVSALESTERYCNTGFIHQQRWKGLQLLMFSVPSRWWIWGHGWTTILSESDLRIHNSPQLTTTHHDSQRPTTAHNDPQRLTTTHNICISLRLYPHPSPIRILTTTTIATFDLRWPSLKTIDHGISVACSARRNPLSREPPKVPRLFMYAWYVSHL